MLHLVVVGEANFSFRELDAEEAEKRSHVLNYVRAVSRTFLAWYRCLTPVEWNGTTCALSTRKQNIKKNVLSDDVAQPLASNDNGNVVSKILYLGAYKYGVKKWMPTLHTFVKHIITSTTQTTITIHAFDVFRSLLSFNRMCFLEPTSRLHYDSRCLLPFIDK